MLTILLLLALMVTLGALVRSKAALAVLGARDPATDHDPAHRLAIAEEELAALRATLDGIGEGVLAIDQRGRIVLANRRFSEMLGTSGEIAGKPLAGAIRVHAVLSACDAALGGNQSIQRFSMQTGMTERRIEVRAMPLASEQIAAVALLIEITDAERVE